MSQEYMASRRRGDQSSSPCLKASWAKAMRLPVACEKRVCTGTSVLVVNTADPRLINSQCSAFSAVSSISIFYTKYAIPCTGSLHSGPRSVLSWKAVSILSSNDRMLIFLTVPWSISCKSSGMSSFCCVSSGEGDPARAGVVPFDVLEACERF